MTTPTNSSAEALAFQQHYGPSAYENDENNPKRVAFRQGWLAALSSQHQASAPADVNHRQGCEALGGYGNGIGACSCGAAPADVESFVLPASQVDALAELHFSTLNYLHCHQWREFARDVARASLRSWEESKGQK